MNHLKYFFSHYYYQIGVALFLLITLFFVSPDSQLHYTFGRNDCAIFFSSGKAWMNGMTPYVDFADSKGPLLWLIYGIGYLISHYDYTGVFWLSWLSYTICFLYLYKIADYFLKEKALAFISCIVMGIAIFFPWFHYEVKSEDWCQPFIVASLYYACRIVFSQQPIDIKNICRAFFVFGISFSATLLIKYNISAMLISIYIYVIIILIKNRIGLFKPIICGLSGASLIILPFAIYLIVAGAFNAFINEYFINTLKTINQSQYHSNFFHELLYHIGYAERVYYFIFSMFGCFGIYIFKHKNMFFLPFILSCFWIISLHHADAHYFNACTSFPIFFIICAIHSCRNILNKQQHLSTSITTIISLFIIIITNCFQYGYIDKTFITQKSAQYTEMITVNRILKKIKNPKVIYYYCIDRGDGIAANALPGSVYWTSQLGATTEMQERQLVDIKQQKADFIFIESKNQPDETIKIKTLEAMGYHLVYKYKSENNIGRLRAILSKHHIM